MICFCDNAWMFVSNRLGRACCKRGNEKCDPFLHTLFPLHLLELHELKCSRIFQCLSVHADTHTYIRGKNPLYFNSCVSKQYVIQIA